MTTLTRYSDLTGTSEVVQTVYSHDHADRLAGITDKTSGGTTVASYSYTLDDANRLTQETQAWRTSGGGSGSDTMGFSYTNNDQLTAVTHTNGSFANESFSYDINVKRTIHGNCLR
jgi:hypothetical protein